MLKKGVNSTTETRKWASATLVWSLNPGWISCAWPILSKGTTPPSSLTYFHQGFWQGAAKNGELCSTIKVNCAAKKTIYAANCAAVNSSFQMFFGGLGVLNGVLIGILVYLSEGINISTWNHISCNTNTQFFLKFHLKNQHTYYLQYSTWNPLYSYEVICITRQKDKVEQLPDLWNMEHKSRQNVCLASCITSVDVRHTDTVWVTQLESSAQVPTIAIENQLHFMTN